MRFFSVGLTLLAATSSARAISASDIISSLNAITLASTTATDALHALTKNPTTANIQAALAASHDLRDFYNVLDEAITSDDIPVDPTADQATINTIGQAAKEAGSLATPYGIALADAAIGPLKSAGKFREACDDGIDIGVVLIVMFTQIDIRYPSSLALDAVAAVADFAKVPLTRPLAATCFTPGGLPPFKL
ncbi:hypothetical protein CPB83DRAFT_163676 [Crepidotus variabilis]|uniref:Uncharacterized protein n=1 Tax=Crepidotus variabilis TaxID=179855 RepID=A0A9P6JI58_9AGAR|nr:hypothetical protein CPB83DRAFT_163676 [Crepidotus variabilis]